jgi:hypothetical protein
MERRPGLAPGKNCFAGSRLDGFGMRRIKWKEPPAGIAPASIPFRRRVPDLFEPRGRKLGAPAGSCTRTTALEERHAGTVKHHWRACLKWSGTPVTLRVYPAPKAGGLAFFLVPEETCTHGRTRARFPFRSETRSGANPASGRVEQNGGRDGCCPRSLLLDRQANMLLLLASKIGCPRWIRTIIGGFRVRSPTVGRQGRISGEPGGSCNLTNVRLKVGCRSAVASGP